MENVEQPDVGLNHPAKGVRAQLGELLHRERVSQQKEGVDVARRLMLSKLQLHAVETGQAESFHHERRYILAVKSYVSYLNLDHDQETSELLKQVEALSEGGAGASPAAGVAQLHVNAAIPARPRSYAARRPRFIPVVVGVLIVGAIALALSEGWPFGDGEESLSTVQTIQTAPTQTVTTINAVTPLAPSTSVAVSTTPSANAAAALSTASGTAATVSASQGSPASSTSSSPPSLSASSASVGVSASTVPPAGATSQSSTLPTPVVKAPLPAASNRPSMMRLDFSADCWVSLQTADGKKEERIYKQGQHVEVPASSVTALVLGNAAAATMTLGERQIDLMAKNLTQGSITRIDQKSLQALQKN